VDPGLTRGRFAPASAPPSWRWCAPVGRTFDQDGAREFVRGGDGGWACGPCSCLRQDGPRSIHITGDADADQVLTDSPFALLVGMMLDQQVR
jgi:hypothetical protein